MESSGTNSVQLFGGDTPEVSLKSDHLGQTCHVYVCLHNLQGVMMEFLRLSEISCRDLSAVRSGLKLLHDATRELSEYS